MAGATRCGQGKGDSKAKRDCARFRAKTPEQRAAAGAMMRACKAPNYRALRVLI